MVYIRGEAHGADSTLACLCYVDACQAESNVVIMAKQRAILYIIAFQFCCAVPNCDSLYSLTVWRDPEFAPDSLASITT